MNRRKQMRNQVIKRYKKKEFLPYNKNDISFLKCWLAFQKMKPEIRESNFGDYRAFLADVSEECGKFEMINLKLLKRLGLAKEKQNINSHFNKINVANRINKEHDQCYATVDRYYNFSTNEVIPCSFRIYFVLLIICLNNCSDDEVNKFLEYQVSIYPNSDEFLNKLRINVREYSEKEIISKSKAQTVNDWIEQANPQYLEALK